MDLGRTIAAYGEDVTRMPAEEPSQRPSAKLSLKYVTGGIVDALLYVQNPWGASPAALARVPWPGACSDPRTCLFPKACGALQGSADAGEDKDPQTDAMQEITRSEWLVEFNTTPFAQGSMRDVFHLSLADETLDSKAQGHVAKVAKKSGEGDALYLEDVRMQILCKYLAQLFNSYNPPKKIDFLDAFLIACPVSGCLLSSLSTPAMPLPRRSPHLVHAAQPFNNMHIQERDNQLVAVEPLLPGEYKKHSNNAGYVHENLRNTPHAFSHFSYHVSQGMVLVCDIQGVDDKYTDPQIHSYDGKGFGAGNLGPEGFKYGVSSLLTRATPSASSSVCHLVPLDIVVVGYQGSQDDGDAPP
eukprot:gene8589-1535_t